MYPLSNQRVLNTGIIREVISQKIPKLVLPRRTPDTVHDCHFRRNLHDLCNRDIDHHVGDQQENFYGLLNSKTMGNGLGTSTGISTTIMNCNCGKSAVFCSLKHHPGSDPHNRDINHFVEQLGNLCGQTSLTMGICFCTTTGNLHVAQATA